MRYPQFRLEIRQKEMVGDQTMQRISRMKPFACLKVSVFSTIIQESEMNFGERKDCYT